MDCRIINLKPIISPLKDLKILKLRNIQISDLSPLKDLKNLEFLELADSQNDNLKPLKDLINLRALWLYGNQISDTSNQH